MAEEVPQFNPKFEEQAKGLAIGNNNIIYNYFGYREEIKADSVDVADDNLVCPYRGLYHFSPNDAKFFFGREVFIQQLFKATQTHNFIPVLGASGSGKSSVVLAGLVPKLEQEKCWKFTHFRPSDGNDPFYALAKALVPLYRSDLDSTDEITQSDKLAKHLEKGELSLAKVFSNIQQKNPNHKVLLIVDQFEELYTQYSDLTFRHRFLDCLLANFQSPNSRSSSSTVLVATMRADFLANALSYRPFADMLQNTDIKLGAMSRKELIQVIEKPAQTLGISFEEGLVERILDDVEHEPGHLPLLEFALAKLWDKRRDKRLTHAAYEELGKVNGALAKYADEKYSQLTSKEQKQARQIFIQLIRPGEGNEDTRRRANRAELGEENWDLIKRKNGLADSRLVVTDRQDTEQKTVEIVHEALIQNWGQLRQWMDIDREFRSWQERLRTTIQQWKDTKKDDGGLLRSALLSEAEGWLKRHPDGISSKERDFIRKSIRLRDRSLRRTIAGLVGGLIGAITLTGIATWQWQRSVINEINTTRESTESLLASNRELDALIASLRAAKQIKGAFGVDKDTRIRVMATMQNTFYRVREYNRLLGSTDSLNSVAFSPDGQTIASGSDREIVLWNLKGEVLTTISDYRDGLQSIVFSSDGQTITSSSSDGTVKLWNLKGELLSTLEGYTDELESIVLSPDGQTIASTSSDGTVKLWNLKGELLTTISNHRDELQSVVFSPDNKIIASAGFDNTIKIWNFKGELLKTLEGDKIAFSPDGKTIASAGLDNTIKIWNFKGELLKTLDLDNLVKSIVFSPNGETLASVSDDTVELWNLAGEQLANISGNIEVLNRVVFSPDGQMIASFGYDGTVELFDLRGLLLSILDGHTGWVNDVVFSPDGKTLASASFDRTIKLWNVKEKLLTIIDDHPDWITSVVFSPDGEIIAFADVNGTVQLRNRKGELLVTMSGDGSIVDPAFSLDGEIIASGGRDNTVKLWNRKGELLTTLSGHTDEVSSVAFSLDGEIIASGSSDNTVKLWNRKGELLATLKGHLDGVSSIVFSPDGEIIASASKDGNIKLWNVKGKLLATLSKHTDEVSSVAFSPDGEIIASGSSDNTVKLWNRKGELLATLKGHLDGVSSIVFSPDGEIIASASKDGNIKLWNVKGKLLATLSGRFSDGIDIAFSPDGKTIASTSILDYGLNTSQLWNRKGELLATLRGHLDSIGTVVFSPDGQTLISSGGVDEITSTFWSFNLDELMARGCYWARDYLENNPDVEQRDRHLCDGIEPTFTIADKIAAKAIVNKVDQHLTLNPETKAAPALVIQGENLVKEEKFIEAIARYEEAQKLIPEIDLYPETEAIDKDIETVLRLLVPEEELIVGVGINIYQDEETKQLVIESPIENTSAMMAGIKAKDIVTKIDDKSTEAMDLNEAIKHIGGSIGTEVKLTILRDGEELEFLLKRMPFKRRKNN